MSGKLFDGVYGLPDVADVNAGKDTDQREQEGVREGVEDRKQIDFTEEAALRQRNEYADKRSRADHYNGGELAVKFEFFHDHRDVYFDKRDGGGDRSEQHEQEEDHAHDAAEHGRHGVENGGQHHEYESRSRGGRFACREYGGQNGEAGYHSDHGVGYADEEGVFGKAYFFTRVASVGGTYSESYREGVERLSEGGKENSRHAAGGFDPREIGYDEEFNAFERSFHRKRHYHNEYEHDEKQGHKHLIDALDTVLDA